MSAIPHLPNSESSCSLPRYDIEAVEPERQVPVVENDYPPMRPSAMTMHLQGSVDNLDLMDSNPQEIEAPSDEKKDLRESRLLRKKLSFSPKTLDNAPVVLTWQNLSVTTITAKPKVLLDNISGTITGGFWAIMGASGGGKTTLLSTLSLRLDPNRMKITGEVRLNGHEYTRKELKAMSAYVMQDDLLHAELTVAETLYYAAQLRLPQEFTNEQRQQRIEECLNLMGIGYCRDVIVGDTRRKGISGGERKRLCVAIELLSKPLLVFLDEPTSGLDSTTALSVCGALKNLAESGQCTVVCTIHQPQQKIFNLFDNLILLKKGKVIYQGGCQKSLLFLESIGLPCPPDTNPADHLLDVIAPTAAAGGSVDEAVTSREKEALPIDLSMGLDKEFFSEHVRATWFHQFYIITMRSGLQYIRRSDIIMLNFFSTALIAGFIGGGIWYQQQHDQKAATTTLIPSLFFACVTQGIFGSMQVVNTFPSERAIMLRERAAGTYFVSSYYCAKSLVDMLSQLWPPVLFSCIAYFMLGYRVEADKFFIYMAFMMLDSLAATSLATAVSCWCISVERSTVALSFLFEMCRLYGGFFTSPLQLKEHYGWSFADALSYIKYAFIGVTLNELQGAKFSCPATGTCLYPTGEDLIKAKGYGQYTIEEVAGILLVYIFIARFIGYLALRLIKV